MRTRRVILPAIAIAMALTSLPSVRPAGALTVSEVQARIKTIRTQLSSLGQRLHQAGERLTEARQAVSRHRAALANAERRKETLRVVMADRAAQLYKLGDEAAIADPASITVLADRLAYLEQIQRGERGVIEELRSLQARAKIETEELARALSTASAADRELRIRQDQLSRSLRELSQLQTFLASVGPRVNMRVSRGTRAIYCPVIGPVNLRNDWGAPRRSGPHTGIDLDADYGQGVRAVLPGTIVDTPTGGWMGIGIILRDLAGNEWWYAHLQSRAVRRGERVLGGEFIGRVGCTGNCFGSHLHFELHPGGGGPVNPYRILSRAC